MGVIARLAAVDTASKECWKASGTRIANATPVWWKYRFNWRELSANKKENTLTLLSFEDDAALGLALPKLLAHLLKAHLDTLPANLSYMDSLFINTISMSISISIMREALKYNLIWQYHVWLFGFFK